MQYPAHLKPEQRFLRIVFVGVLSIAGPAGDFAKWCVSGVAAILALLIANLASVSAILSHSSLKWGMIFLAVSLLAGVFAVQLSMGVRMGTLLIESLYQELATPEAQAAIAASTLPTHEMTKQMCEPFLWPWNRFMLRGATNGVTDALKGEKRFVKMFCLLMYASMMQTGTAVLGLIVFACGFK